MMNSESAVLSVQGTTAMRSFGEIHDQVGEACKWIASMGVPVSGTRFAMYQRDMADLAANHKGGQETLDRLTQRMSNLVNSALEAMDLVTIHRGLLNYPDQNVLHDRLRMLISGPEFGSSENPDTASNRARNYSFELLMAARAAAGGYNVDLSDIADVVLRKGKKTIYIECKRPQSAGKVNKNVKDGLNQLTKRINSDPEPRSARAIMALAVDKAIPVAHRILRTPNASTADVEIAQVVKQFYNDHHGIWKSTRDGRTIGVLLSLRTLAVLTEHNLITVVCHDFIDEHTGKAADGSPTTKPVSMEDRLKKEEDHRLIVDIGRAYKSSAYL